MKEKPSDKARLEHIHDALNDIEEMIQGFDLESFRWDKRTKLAVVKLLEIIGEAAYHLTEETLLIDNTIPWRQIMALRHILVHEYYGIQPEIVWNVANNEAKVLIPKVRVLLASL